MGEVIINNDELKSVKWHRVNLSLQLVVETVSLAVERHLRYSIWSIVATYINSSYYFLFSELRPDLG